MDDDIAICPKCGLPIGRGPSHGAIWTPEVKGVEVCGCPPEDVQQREHADELLRDLHTLEKELDDLKHGD
jgi:hypothetical protein